MLHALALLLTLAPAPTAPGVPFSADTPATVHRTGDIDHIADKLGQFSVTLLDGTVVAGATLNEEISETGFLSAAERFLPATATYTNGCPGDSMARGAGYLANRGAGIDTGAAGSFNATWMVGEIMDLLFPGGQPKGAASVTDPVLWKAHKDSLVGSWVTTDVEPFPPGKGIEWWKAYEKDLNSGVPSEIVIDLTNANKSTCTVNGHVAVGLRTLSFAKHPGLIGFTIADDWKQGDRFAQTYERGPFIVDRATGEILSGGFKGGKVSHRIRERRKPLTTGGGKYAHPGVTPDDTKSITDWFRENEKRTQSGRGGR